MKNSNFSDKESNNNNNNNNNGGRMSKQAGAAASASSENEATSKVASQNISAVTTLSLGYQLNLIVSDPLVCAELQARSGLELEKFANVALSIGVMCLQQTSSRVDVQSLQTIMEQAKETVAEQGKEIVLQIETVLGEYFDPKTGLMPTRITALIQKNGELESVLDAKVGGDNSLIAQTMAQHLGPQSPIFKLLSPGEQNLLIAHIKTALHTMLNEQSKGLLDQFSLDNKASALNRFLLELTEKHGLLHQGIDKKIDAVRSDFSLDLPDSAMSRLMTGIVQSQQKITDEFTLDSETSVLSRLTSMMQATHQQIEQQLTLDNENSALNKIMRKLDGTQQEILKSHIQLHSAFAALDARKQEQARSTEHGLTFEDDLAQMISKESHGHSDVFQCTGKMTGSIPHSKKGDYVVELGPESIAPGARIVLEAKEDKSWTEKRALSELIEASKNRQAEVGVFVFSRKTAPEGIPDFARYGNNILVVWDSENPATDITVRVAYSLARALVVRAAKKSGKDQDMIRNIERAARAIEKQVEHLEEIQKLAQTVKGHGEKIIDKSERMRKELCMQIETLNEQIDSLGSGDEV